MHTRRMFVYGLIIGTIGAIGQAWILRHELVNNYPYKIMDYPPAEIYATIGVIGLFLCPLIGLGIGWFLSFKKEWLAWISPVTVCPLAFSVVFVAYTLIWQLSGVEPVGKNFDNTTPTQVALAFIQSAFTLSVIGLAIAIAAWFGTSRLLRVLKIP